MRRLLSLIALVAFCTPAISGATMAWPLVIHDYPLQPATPVLMAEGACEQGAEYGFEISPLWVRRQACYSYLAGGQTQGRVLHLAARHAEGTWAMIYLADPTEFSVHLASLPGPQVSASWINPATGKSATLGSFANAGAQSFTTHAGWEDSLLVLESAGAAETAVPPTSSLSAWKSRTQSDLPGTGAAAAEVVPEGRDSAAPAR